MLFKCTYFIWLFIIYFLSPAKTVQTKFDAATLHSNTALAAETQMIDDGTGKVEVSMLDGKDFTILSNLLIFGLWINMEICNTGS